MLDILIGFGLDLELNHPIKYLIWTIQNENDINNNLDFHFTSDLNYNKINNYPNIITAKNINYISDYR